MAWIEPLAMETWVVQVLSGSLGIFTAVFVLFVSTMAGYFRMNGIGLLMTGMLGLLIFKEWIEPSVLMLVMIFTGLLIGYWASRIVK